MTQPPGKKHLTDEEIAYLQELFHDAEALEASEYTEVGLTLSAENEALLQRLLEMRDLQLGARYGQYRFVFPLQLHRTEAGDLTVRLQLPAIFDLEGQARGWRAPVAHNEVQLFDERGLLHHPRAIDISTSGISVVDDLEHLPAMGQRLSELFLRLPGLDAPAHVEGTVARVFVNKFQGRKVMAIHFRNPDATLEEAIREYVYKRHQQEVGS